MKSARPFQRISLAILCITALGCFCGALFDPAGNALKKAQKLSDDGKHAEAATQFQEAIGLQEDALNTAISKQDYGKAHKAVLGLHTSYIGAATSTFSAKNYRECAQLVNQINAISKETTLHKGPQGQATPWVDPLAVIDDVPLREDLFITTLVDSLKQGNNPDAVLEYGPVLATRIQDADFKVDLHSFVCASAPNASTFKACQALPSDVSQITELSQLANANRGCEQVQPLTSFCQEALVTTIQSMASPDQIYDRWKSLAEKESKNSVRAAKAAAKRCASAKARKQSIEDRYMRQILYGSRTAVIDAALAMQPHDEVVGTYSGKMRDICTAAKNAHWPESVKRTTVEAISGAMSSCEGTCYLPK